MMRTRLSTILRAALLGLVVSSPGPSRDAFAAAPAAAKLDRTTARLPAGFTGIEAEPFFWRLPGAREGVAADAATSVAGTYAFRIKLGRESTPLHSCDWRVEAGKESQTVTVRGASAFADGIICLTTTRTTRVLPVTKASGEVVREKEAYEKSFAVKVADGLETIRKSQTNSELVLTFEAKSPAEAARLAASGLGAVLVADVDGTPDFDLTEAEPEGASETGARRNGYLIPSKAVEVWLFDRKSGEILLKKALHP